MTKTIEQRINSKLYKVLNITNGIFTKRFRWEMNQHPTTDESLMNIV